jgi:hypothetical protein
MCCNSGAECRFYHEGADEIQALTGPSPPPGVVAAQAAAAAAALAAAAAAAAVASQAISAAAAAASSTSTSDDIKGTPLYSSLVDCFDNELIDWSMKKPRLMEHHQQVWKVVMKVMLQVESVDELRHLLLPQLQLLLLLKKLHWYYFTTHTNSIGQNTKTPLTRSLTTAARYFWS